MSKYTLVTTETVLICPATNNIVSMQSCLDCVFHAGHQDCFIMCRYQKSGEEKNDKINIDRLSLCERDSRKRL